MDGKGFLSDGASRHNPINGPLTGTQVSSSGGSNILGKANKIDPYYLITQVFTFYSIYVSIYTDK